MTYDQPFSFIGAPDIERALAADHARPMASFTEPEALSDPDTASQAIAEALERLQDAAMTGDGCEQVLADLAPFFAARARWQEHLDEFDADDLMDAHQRVAHLVAVADPDSPVPGLTGEQLTRVCELLDHGVEHAQHLPETHDSARQLVDGAVAAFQGHLDRPVVEEIFVRYFQRAFDFAGALGVEVPADDGAAGAPVPDAALAAALAADEYVQAPGLLSWSEGCSAWAAVDEGLRIILSLQGLPRLVEEIEIESEVSDLSPLARLPALQVVRLGVAEGADLAPLLAVHTLTEVELTGAEEGDPVVEELRARGVEVVG